MSELKAPGRTYGYARCSTDSQTLDSQIHALVHAGVEGRYIATDEAISGAVPWADREGLKMLVATLQPGDTLVVYSLSRVGRSTLDILTLLDVLTKRGVFFRSVTEAFDSATPMGRAMLSIMAALAQLERDLAIERTKAGLAAAKAAGRQLGRAETPGRREAVAALLDAGATLPEIAVSLGIAYNSAKRMAAKVREERANGPAF